METALVILSVGLLVFLAHFFSALFQKTRIPDVLPLLLLGFLGGPILHWVTPAAFGKVGGVFTVVALVILLFQSGLGLRPADLKGSFWDGLKLTLFHYLMTMPLVALLARAFLGLTWLEAAVLGSILGGTSSAVVIPMVERIRLGGAAKTSLLLESTFSDVFCIVGTLGLLNAVKGPGLQVGVLTGEALLSFLLAGVIGGACAFLWSLVLGLVHRLENSAFMTPAFVFILYGGVELAGYSGAIAALSFGVVLGNISSLPLLGRWEALRPVTLKGTEKEFFSEIVFLLKTFFFVYIGLSLKLDNLFLFWGGIGFVLFLFALRMAVVWISLSRKASAWDASVAAVMNPKGLAAAVLAGLPLKAGLAGGATIQSVVYAVVLFSIVGSALLVFLLNFSPIRRFYAAFFKGFSQEPGP